MKHLKSMATAALACAALAGGARAGTAEDAAAVVHGRAEFAVDLYRMMAREKGNLFFSSSSMETAFGMVGVGARGKTADEIASAFHFPFTGARLDAAAAGLARESHGEGIELAQANGLWLAQGEPFLEGFLTPLQTTYRAEAQQVDFAKDPEAARRRINAWVAGKTRDRIQDLFKEGDIQDGTVVALANAIYFKGSWEVKFKADKTSEEAFGGIERKVHMMHRSVGGGEDVRFAEDDLVQALELPYKGGDLSMVILLPTKRDGLRDLEKALGARSLDGWLAALEHPYHLSVSIPKFKMTHEIDLIPVLKDMGIKSAFDTSADFSGMTKRAVFIGAARHKAFVEVNEEGTEAAAATGIAGRAAGPRPQTFVADHPFIFLIRDRKTGEILFMGRVVDPTV